MRRRVVLDKRGCHTSVTVPGSFHLDFCLAEGKKRGANTLYYVIKLYFLPCRSADGYPADMAMSGSGPS